MSFKTRITRKIEIDMGHRVTNHGSKCRNVHGHRYVIEAEVEGVVQEAAGEAQGMVIDFGALKSVMMEVIDSRYDHGLALWVEDPIVPVLMGVDVAYVRRPAVSSVMMSPFAGRVILLNVVPTAENLAEIWFGELEGRLPADLRLTAVTVYETPNCWATYRPENA